MLLMKRVFRSFKRTPVLINNIFEKKDSGFMENPESFHLYTNRIFKFYNIDYA